MANTIPVAPAGSDPGSLATEPGSLQFGRMLLGTGSAAGWRELQGWRGAEGDSTSVPRVMQHGAFPGHVFSGPQVVTFKALLVGSPAEKAAALQVLERFTPLDSALQTLVVNDGAETTQRQAQFVARQVPQDAAFHHGAVPISLQWECPDPYRYGLTLHQRHIEAAHYVGGLQYPLQYPLDYGGVEGGKAEMTNAGNMPAPLLVTFRGAAYPGYSLAVAGQMLRFAAALGNNDALTINTHTGATTLNGTRVDPGRLLARSSVPPNTLRLPRGTHMAYFRGAAIAGNRGSVDVQWRDTNL